MMSIEDMRSLSDADLTQEIENRREEWRNLRFQNALGRLTTFHEISGVRKAIARMKTIQRERQIALAPEQHFAETTKLRARRRREKQDEALSQRKAKRRQLANKGRKRRV